MGADLDGARVLVTGASSGIGAALAEGLAEQGAIVGLCARREERLAEVLGRCRAFTPQSQMWTCDLAEPGELDVLAERVQDEWLRLDMLVNNAGIPKRRHVTALDPADIESVMRINYLAPVRLTLALLPSLLASRHGRIVNVSSVAAVLSSPGEAAYDASKAALSAFSEAMAIDLWDTAVDVMVVYPGLVATELFDVPDNDPPPSTIESIGVDEVVEAVLDGLARGASEVYVPSWFKDIAVGKAGNLDGFLAGAAAFVAEQQGQR
jgi:short-subunit dehydrogenase